MQQRNENSVLFSLAHLQQMAMATSTNAVTTTGQRPVPADRLTNPRPVVSQPAIHTLTTSPDYVPVSLPSSVLMSPKPRWPRWLAPAIVGLGVLFIAVLVLALAIALRPPAPVATPAGKTIATPEGKLPAHVKGPDPRSAAPAKVVDAEKKVEQKAAPNSEPEPRKVKPKKKLAKRKKRARRLARLRRKRRRRRRRIRRIRRQRARRRSRNRRRSSTYKPYRKLKNHELDAMLSSAAK